MALFGRSDGDRVAGEPPVRRIMPDLVRGRDESAVYQGTACRAAGAGRRPASAVVGPAGAGA